MLKTAVLVSSLLFLVAHHAQGQTGDMSKLLVVACKFSNTPTEELSAPLPAGDGTFYFVKPEDAPAIVGGSYDYQQCDWEAAAKELYGAEITAMIEREEELKEEEEELTLEQQEVARRNALVLKQTADDNRGQRIAENRALIERCNYPSQPTAQRDIKMNVGDGTFYYVSQEERRAISNPAAGFSPCQVKPAQLAQKDTPSTATSAQSAQPHLTSQPQGNEASSGAKLSQQSLAKNNFPPTHPGNWIGRNPETHGDGVNFGLPSHPYFQFMTQKRQHYARSQLIQKPHWWSGRGLLTLSYRSPTFYQTVEGCNFKTPVELVEPELFKYPDETTYSQQYVMFKGEDCQLKRDGTGGKQTVTFLAPVWNYDAEEPPLDTTVYVCAEIQDHPTYQLGAFTLTHEYFPRDRRHYYIALNSNVREFNVIKNTGDLRCSGEDSQRIAQRMVGNSFKYIPTKPAEAPPVNSSGGRHCYWVTKWIPQANGGSDVPFNEEVCENF